VQDEVPFKEDIEWILMDYCFKCHGEGKKKGGVIFDEFETDEDAVAKTDLWLRVLKNTRAGFMPPADEDQLEPDDQARLEHWIKQQAFGIDARHPDPGRVTVRRLNRVEYRNTVRDLLGSDFNSEIEFPADDSGHGFDNIGEVLSISPLLMEKYVQAATSIIEETVPSAPLTVSTHEFEGKEFLPPANGLADISIDERGRGTGERLSFYDPAEVSAIFDVPKAGEYKLNLIVNVRGGFDFNAARSIVIFNVDDREVWRQEYSWEDNRTFPIEFLEQWDAGNRRLTFEMQPVPDTKDGDASFTFRIVSVEVQGPTRPKDWVTSPNYDRFFPEGPAPRGRTARDAYAGRLLEDFASRAFRRPVDANTVKRLVAVARSVYSQPGNTFEAGVSRAMTAVLASPRFILRLEEAQSNESDPNPHPQVDEWSLASRLSYFLWSTMPDEELFELADRGELRNQLDAQVKRMLRDPKAKAFVSNFSGQWLQTRDVEFVPIDARTVLGIKASRINGRRVEFDQPLRRAMRAESEKVFEYIIQNDRSVLEFLDADYTFLNERLAEHYEIPGVEGDELQFVTLPPDSPRGGVLTQGAVLAVTSNPTRTSPVKRGLFILDNLLGSPSAPPPPDIPALEDSQKELASETPSLREMLAIHREKPLCSSCHNRMDPLGLAMENFNALGMWREFEALPPLPSVRSPANASFRAEPSPEDLTPKFGAAIDASGQLITGESFNGVIELKRILIENHQREFYQSLTEKLLTYAIGRGLDYYDVESVDRITVDLENEDGSILALINGVINSAPFQRQRASSPTGLAKMINTHNDPTVLPLTLSP
jgi:hypothetical protein